LTIGSPSRERDASPPKRRHVVAIRGLRRSLGVDRAQLKEVLVTALEGVTVNMLTTANLQVNPTRSVNANP